MAAPIPPENDCTANRPAFRANETTFDPTDFRLAGSVRRVFLTDFVLESRLSDFVIMVELLSEVLVN